MDQPDTGLPALKFCLYARKSTEAEERQALSIDSQIKEMRQLAKRENLHVAAIRSEAHSAKHSGKRPVFNHILMEIKEGKFNALLTWNTDRLSRNAGDLGQIVDLIDNQRLIEIRTINQRFTDSPNDKFLLMILGSQAKLENDNKGVNVRRGLRALVERGGWPGVPPMGYKCDPRVDRKGFPCVDHSRAYVIRQMFEKAAEGWPSRRIRTWLRKDVNFLSTGGKHLSLSMVQKILNTTFYYGEYEYPVGSGKWYKGKHKPIVSKELYEKVQKQFDTRRHPHSIYRKNFAYTRLMRCGLCGSSICAEEKVKLLKNGSFNKYVYYGCTRFRNNGCKLGYIREADLIVQLLNLVDQLSIDELGVREQVEMESDRIYRFYQAVEGNGKEDRRTMAERDIDTKRYMKYLLEHGTIDEKRYVLLNLRSRLILRDKQVFLDKENGEEPPLLGVERGVDPYHFPTEADDEADTQV